MNNINLDRSGEPLEEIVDPGDTYKAELDAARQDLQGEPSELTLLLNHIHRKKASRKQVPGLLKQACVRLKKIRENQTDLSDLIAKEPEIAALIEQADGAVQNGDQFSLENTNQLYEKAFDRYLEHEGEPEISSSILAQQAQIAAIKQDYQRAAELFAAAATTPGLEESLQWQYQNNRASVLEDLGREFGDNAALEQAIDLYESTVIALAPQKERPGDWATTQNNLGNARGILGQRQRGPQMLESAVVAFQDALSERPRDQVPLEWATTQNNLGNALGALGQRQGNTELLEKSVEAFESALEERSQELTPSDWATTQNNLGAVLQTLGQRQSKTKLLKKSITAYTNVLKEWTRERAPLDWATTLNNLGVVFHAYGKNLKGPRTLEKSVAAYKNALSERTRGRVPQDWAMTQNNLGASLQTLGERQQSRELLEESIAAYENALMEWTLEQLPMNWAMTTANLGVARRTLAEQIKDIDIARQAVTDFGAVMDVFRNASHAHYFELGEEQLVKARAVVAELGGD